MTCLLTQSQPLLPLLQALRAVPDDLKTRSALADAYLSEYWAHMELISEKGRDYVVLKKDVDRMNKYKRVIAIGLSPTTTTITTTTTTAMTVATINTTPVSPTFPSGHGVGHAVTNGVVTYTATTANAIASSNNNSLSPQRPSANVYTLCPEGRTNKTMIDNKV